MHEVMGWDGPVTYRQLLAESAWDDEQWNIPDRSDAYAMQIACEVRRNAVRNPRRVKLEHMQLEFRKSGKSLEPKLTKEQATELSKAKWLTLVGKKPVEIIQDTASMGS